MSLKREFFYYTIYRRTHTVGFFFKRSKASDKNNENDETNQEPFSMT